MPSAARGGRGRPRAGGGDRRERADGGDRRDDRGGGHGSRRRLNQDEYDGPPIPDEVTGRELDRRVRDQLRQLPERLGLRVAKHLVAAGLLLADGAPDDLETAYAHARAARARASRVPAVREAFAELAYLTGRYEEALRELRTVRRMTGSPDALPLMADCERALGRPDKALALGREPAASKLEPAGRAELAVVLAGARRDKGQLDAALGVLEGADLRSRTRADWVPRLRYAYADALAAAGRTDAALEWFHRAAAVDTDQVTDARDRAEALERTAGS